MNFHIDPELKYCLDCGEEYRAEIRTCADCGRELLSGTEVLEIRERERRRKAGRSMELGPDDDLVPVQKGPVIQIKELQVKLERHGIPALSTGDQGGCGKGCCGTDMTLFVRREDLRDVADLLQQDYVQTTGLLDHDLSNLEAVFNTAAEEATCPACGCTFSTSQAACPDCGLQFV